MGITGEALDHVDRSLLLALALRRNRVLVDLSGGGPRRRARLSRSRSRRDDRGGKLHQAADYRNEESRRDPSWVAMVGVVRRCSHQRRHGQSQKRGEGITGSCVWSQVGEGESTFGGGCPRGRILERDSPAGIFG